METALREVRVALLEADVNFKVVKQLLGSRQNPRHGPGKCSRRFPHRKQIIGIINEE